VKKTFNAVATREGKWWVVDVDGVGVTQGRTTAEAEGMAVDLVSAMRELPESAFEVKMEFRLPDDTATEIAEARAAQKAAAAATSTAAAKSRQALRGILAAGLSKRDAARVLGVTPQRVSQLSSETSAGRLSSKATRSSRSSQQH
jgi:DNA-directed RNA polymerase specialized sigma subunit